MKFVIFLFYLVIGLIFSGYFSGMIFALMTLIKTRNIELIERYNNDGTFEIYVDQVVYRKKNVFEKVCEYLIWPVTMVLEAYDIYRLFIDDYEKQSQ